MRKSFFLFSAAVLTIFTFGCRSKAEKELSKKEIKRNKSAFSLLNAASKPLIEKKIDDIVSKMSDEEKVAQLFLVNVAGNADFKPTERLVPGGYLLFSYNIAETPEKLKSFTESIKNYCTSREIIPPYITVDQEGGYVNRLREITSPLPSQKRVSNENSVADAYKLYKKQGEEMKNLGFHLNLAPVSEVETDENKDFLQTRTFGNLEKTISYSRACVNGYENSGVGAVLKHFPGNSSTDPHTGLPSIITTKEDFEKNYIQPFKRLVLAGGSQGVSAVLMSHAKVEFSDVESNECSGISVGSGVPACLSKYWIDEVLRKRLGFEGLVISDDIFMGALSDNGFPPEVAVASAVKAGVNVLMISEKKFVKEAEFLLKLAEEDAGLKKNIDESVRKIIRFKLEKGVMSSVVETSSCN